MQKDRGRLPIYLIAILVFSSCLMHFFQLLKFTDKSTGYFNGDSAIPFIVYILVFAAVGLAGLYSRHSEGPAPIDLSGGNKRLYYSSAILSAAMFAEFIHQCFSCYDYISKTNYIEYAYIIPLGLAGLSAIICCFYFAVLSITAKGLNYDFRNFTFLHLIPVFWAFMRLILIMIKIVDVKQDSDTVLEFLLLSFMLMFFFSYILMLDNSGRASKPFVFSAISTFALASVISLPRLVMIAVGKGEALYPADYTSISYFAVGLFAVVQIKREKSN